MAYLKDAGTEELIKRICLLQKQNEFCIKLYEKEDKKEIQFYNKDGKLEYSLNTESGGSNMESLTKAEIDDIFNEVFK